jgi:hypothetical protein
MIPLYSGPTKVQVPLYWLVTGVADMIDLNRMSTGDRRDFPFGVSGSHMAGDRATPFREVQFTAPPPNTYLLRFDADLIVGDYRTNKDPGFEEKMYGKAQNYSQEVFVANSGEFAQLGINAIVRYSAPSKAAGIDSDVYGIFPSARGMLTLREIEPIGSNSPPIRIRLFEGPSERLTSDFYST